MRGKSVLILFGLEFFFFSGFLYKGEKLYNIYITVLHIAANPFCVKNREN